MALPKIAIPSPRIFNSDPIEQIYAKGTLDRDMSGLSFMMKNAAQMDRQTDQDAYLSGVSEANKMSSMLAQREEANKNSIEMLKEAVKMATGLGSPTSAMPIMQLLRPGGGDDPGAAAKLQLILSEAGANNAKAANTGNDQYTQQDVITPTGLAYSTQTSKGRNPVMLDEMARQRRLAEAKARGLVSPNPGAPAAIPRASQSDIDAAMRYNNVGR